MTSAGGLRQDTAGCRCVRLRVLALRRVGKRGAFARTVVTSWGGPPGGVNAASPGPLGATGRVSSDPMDMKPNPTLLRFSYI